MSSLTRFGSGMWTLLSMGRTLNAKYLPGGLQIGCFYSAFPVSCSNFQDKLPNFSSLLLTGSCPVVKALPDALEKTAAHVFTKPDRSEVDGTVVSFLMSNFESSTMLVMRDFCLGKGFRKTIIFRRSPAFLAT